MSAISDLYQEAGCRTPASMHCLQAICTKGNRYLGHSASFHFPHAICFLLFLFFAFLQACFLVVKAGVYLYIEAIDN